MTLWVCGIDLSLTGLGLCAIPADWDPGSRESWAKIQCMTLETKRGIPLVARADLLAQDVVSWIGRFYEKEPPKVCHEGYPVGGRVFNIDKLCEVGGIVKRALWISMQIDPWSAPQSTARKLICGKLPQRDRKAATLEVLRRFAQGALDDATDDEGDAIVAANLYRKELGLSFAALTPVEPAKKPSKRRSRAGRGAFRGPTVTARYDRGVGLACTSERHKFAPGHRAGDLCRCGETKRCNQCWVPRAIALFSTRQKNCDVCASKWRDRRGGLRVVDPRRGLPTSGAPRYIWSARSGNAKLGPIPTCIASAESCPSSCSWYGNGCFAAFGPLRYHWGRAGRDGITFDELVDRVTALPRGQLWRYATAGDLPGVGLDLDLNALCILAAASAGRRGFTFTHKPMTDVVSRAVIREANEAGGFAVNLSADTLDQADELAALEIAPVAVVLPVGTVGDVRTPAGRRVVICPAESRGLDCSRCGLCARPDRRGIVGFIAHGQGRNMVSAVARGRRQLPMAEAQA